MRKQWIDIMFGDRWHRKFRYTIDTTFKTWLGDLVDYVLTEFPYLRRRKEFELWFDVAGEAEPCRVVVKPASKSSRFEGRIKGENIIISP